MEEIVAYKAPGNVLVPATQEDQERVARFKLGAGVRLKATQMSRHNYDFHKKVFALFNFCFEYFSEQVDTGVEYRGERVKPSFEVFREQLTILAGWYEANYSIDGSVRLRAMSLSYAKMSDEHKEKFFSDLINAALRHVYKQSHDEAWLRNMIEQLLQFDR